MTTGDAGWQRIFSQGNPFRGDGRFPLPAYSEFMPGPHVGLSPYGGPDPALLADVHGVPVSEYEEALQLQPGLLRIARHLLGELRKLGQGEHCFSRALLADNPYWPEELARSAGALKQERYVLLLPLALSRTQDDKGRVRWTLFGASEEGPARAFWQGFHSAPGKELPAREGATRLGRLLGQALGIEPKTALSGLRILPAGADEDFPAWGDEPIPSWARPCLLPEDGALPNELRYLLTFRPFARLPAAVREAYMGGRLQLLPFPGSLIFFGHRGYRKLARELRGAMQIPLLHAFPGNHAAPTGIRIPQSGWLDEPGPCASPAGGAPHSHGPVVGHVKRTSRWNRTHRDEDEIQVLPREEKVAHVLFSNDPQLLGLYDKPMARNAQLWTHDHHLLLDGPRSGRQLLQEAAVALAAGGHFGYRFFFPPMRAGRYEIYWHRPLCACLPGVDAGAEAVLLDGAPTGYLTARSAAPGEPAVELWPRLLRRQPHLDAIEACDRDPGLRKYTTTYNVRKLLYAHEVLGGKGLPPAFARALLTTAKGNGLETWLGCLPGHSSDAPRAERLKAELTALLKLEDPQPGPALTFERTATRTFEESYYRGIADLAEGPSLKFRRKDNADPAGPGVDPRAERDLEALGDYLHQRYAELAERHGMTGKAHSGDHYFRWHTDFDFPWSSGWLRNQTGQLRERNIVFVIPGRDREQAVLMADHYDTAYMEDVYDKERGGDQTRRAAAGADDNHSATMALLHAAEVLLPLAREGRLARDVWLVHFTGEEFPADCLGARNLAQRLVEGTFRIQARDGGIIDLSRARVRGAYILDMVAHNNDHDRYVFQISPGQGGDAMRLALFAQQANQCWNQSVPGWNAAPERKAAGPSQRLEKGLPEAVAHPLMHGEVRPFWHPRSSLYNTDAQIFSDVGIPVVLFMENYDINRSGYHDTQDTMKNIDLDYGAALTAIAIESVAQAATAE